VGPADDVQSHGRWVMKLRHATRHELEAEARCGGARWSSAACCHLLELVEEETSRVLVADDEGGLRAVLGLAMDRPGDSGERTATIVELAVDPTHAQQGLGSLLVRFAEDIALIEGCSRIEVDPQIEGWDDGDCWPSLGYAGPAGNGVFKALRRLHACCYC
jgi:GNAT superfamily N-acetyltransferase